MNPIKQKILEILNDFPTNYSPIKEYSLKYIKYSSIIDYDLIGIGHRPWVGPYNFVMCLFSPAKKSWFTKFKKMYGKSIPTCYKEFLSVSNGIYFDELDLFGLTPSIYGRSGLLDRSTLQCFDLGDANKYWINGYDVDKNSFHFGGREFSYDEIVGYFIFEDKSINVVRKNGEILSTYTSFKEFLDNELQIAQNMIVKETPEEWWS